MVISYKTLFCFTTLMALTLCLCAACGTSEPPTPTALPTPSVGKIKGKLVPSGGSSIGIVTLGLWSTACEGSGGWQRMDETGYETKTDETGAFLFEDVPPGCYAMFASVSFQQIPFQSNQGGMKRIEVLAGQTTDLGSIPFSK